MAFELPALPYDRTALEPHISGETIDYHHGKHHNAYVVNLNNLTKDTDLANKSLEDANESLRRMLRETYKWLVAPMQEAKPGKGLSDIFWEQFPVNPGATNLSQEIERVLKENELLITEWAPIHLAGMLKQWFWKEGVCEAQALNVWQQTCQQVYLPRLKEIGRASCRERV